MNYIHITKLIPITYIRNQMKSRKGKTINEENKLTSTAKQHQNAGPQYHPKEEKKKKKNATTKKRGAGTRRGKEEEQERVNGWVHVICF